MLKLSLRNFIIALTFFCGIQNLRATCTYTITAANEAAYLPGNPAQLNTLSVCTQYKFVYQLTNNSSIALSDSITFNFPAGISYASLTSFSGAGAVTYVSGTTSPVFSVSGWGPGNTLTLTIMTQTPSCVAPPTPNGFTTISGTNSCNTYPVSNSILVVAPSMQALNVAGSGSLILNIGNVEELVFSVKNNSTNQATLPQINIACSPAATTAYLGNYYLSTSPVSPALANIYTYAYPAAVPASVSPNTPLVAGNISIGASDFNYFFSNSVMPQDSILYIHIPFKVISCGAAGGSYTFTWGCGTNVCSTVNLPTNINVVTGNPTMGVVGFPPFNNGTFCTAAGAPTSSPVGFIYRNNGVPVVGAPVGNARATDLKLYLDEETSFGALDSTTFQISHGSSSIPVPVSLVSSSYFVIGANHYKVYTINLSAWTVTAAGAWNPLGSAHTLADLDGDGFVDDIAEGDSLTITAAYNYNTTTCSAMTTCSFGGAQFPGTEANYDNQCFSIPSTDYRRTGFSIYNVISSYSYAAIGGAGLMTAPADVVEGIPFSVSMCTSPSYQRWGPTGFDFNCPNGYHQLKIILPPGYHLDFSSLPFLSAGTTGISSGMYQMPNDTATGRCGGPIQVLHPTVQEFCQQGPNPGYVLIKFGRINYSNCGPYNETYQLPCINLPMYLDCAGTTAACASIPANFGVDNLSFSLEYICDPGCTSCTSPIVCNGTATYHHCSGSCASYFSTHNDFTLLRQTLGFLNANPVYDCTVAHPLMPLNVATSPTIDLGSAYPGDVINAKVTGIFNGTLPSMPANNGASYSDIYLQIRYDAFAGSVTPDIFNFDTTQGGITITDSVTLASIFVPANTITYTFAVVSGSVQMNFNLPLSARNFINSTTHTYGFSSNLSLVVKTSPFISPTNKHFFNYGNYPLTGLRTEYMGTELVSGHIDNSCDSWGTHFNVLQPANSIGYYPGNFGSYFNQTSTCDVFKVNFLFETVPSKFSLGVDDFPHEFRPDGGLDPNVMIKIPAGYTYLSSAFTMLHCAYAAGSPLLNNYGPIVGNTYPVSGETVSVTPSGTTVNFNGLSGGTSCWPLLDAKYSAFYPIYYLEVRMQPTCTAPATDTIEFQGGYTENTNQPNLALQVHTAFDSKNPVYHVNPVLSVIPPTATSNAYGNQVVFDFTYCNSAGSKARRPWLAIENSMLNSLNLTPATASVKVLPSGPILPATVYTDTSGHQALMVNVDSLNPSVCVQLELTAQVGPNGCPAPGSGAHLDSVIVRYGNECSGAIITSPVASCEQGTVVFHYQRYPSDLQLLVPSGGFPTAPVDLCNGSLPYHFIINSSDIGTISNPAFWINLPAGITIQGGTFTYPIGSINPADTYTFTAPDSYTYGVSSTDPGWDLNSHFATLLSQGLTGTNTTPNNQVDVVLNLQTSCGYNTTDYINFYAGGISSCSQQIATPPAQHRPTINGATPADNLTVSISMVTSDGDTLLNCNNTGHFTVTVTNNGTSVNTHNDVLTVNIPGAPLMVSNTGTAVVAPGTLTWTIPAGTLPGPGTQTFTFDVNLANSLYCKDGIPYIAAVGYNETVNCTATGGSCSISYSTPPAVLLIKACCGCQSISATATNTSCPGASDGTATVTVTGGAAPYYYSWNTTPVQTIQTITGLPMGTYIVTVKGSNGCVTTDTVVVGTDGVAVTAAITPGNTVSCGPLLLHAITVGGLTYQWQLNGVDLPGETGPTLLATVSGNYTVIITNGLCAATSASVSIIILTPDNASFTYASSAYCTTSVNPSPTITGVGGGTFTASPAGLVFVSTSTGQINLAASTPGTYTITYTTHSHCPNSATFVITITAPPVATFHYAQAVYCKTSANPFPIFTGGGVAGTFTSSPAGLVFVSTATGQVNLVASAAGIYTVTNTIPASGGCAAVSATTIIRIINAPVATFHYAAAAYCKTAANPLPIYAAGGGPGTFSASPAGLVFVSTATGQVNLAASAPGTYTVTNTIAASGLCASVSAVTTITITAPPVANFHYASFVYCQTAANPLPIFTGGGVAGTFSALPVGLVFVSTSTGQVDLAASTPGIYIVTNTIPASGGCAAVSRTTLIRITRPADATFNYASAAYCKSMSNPSPVFASGAVAGTFSASPAGLVFVSTATGVINLAASAPGTYTVTNTVAASGGCPAAIATTIVTITAPPHATFHYASLSYCQTAANPSPIFAIGATAGTFSAIPAGLVFVSTSTGQVDLAASTPGTYTVTNFVAGSGGCHGAFATTTITITKPSSGAFSYAAIAYCKTATNPSPIFASGAVAGIFSASPAGLVFVSTATGVINLAASAPGTYTVTNTIPASGGCAAVTATTTVTITAPPVATFHYALASYCQSGINPFPVYALGASPGTFSATPAGLVFVSTSTGQVNLSASTPGTYTVTNLIAAGGGCKTTLATTIITITAPHVATFNYPLPAYCKTGVNPLPVFTGGGTAGTFSATPAGLVFVSTATGEVNLAASAPGTYTVINFIPAGGGCGFAFATTTITITAPPVATFSYASATYCTSGVNPLPVFSGGGVAGTFSASPAGLVFVSISTGQINLAASTPGTYTVLNVIPANGPCGLVRALTFVTIIDCGCDYGTQLPSTISASVNNLSCSINNPVTVISGNITISNSSVVIGSGVTISVPSGSVLNIQHSHLWACQDMWNGIVVQPGGKLVIGRYSLIEDADTAVYVPATAFTAPTDYALVVNATIFNKNHTAIKIDNYSQSVNTYPYIIDDVVFTNRNLPFNTSGPFTSLAVWPTTNNLKVLQNSGTLQEHYINAATYPMNATLNKAPYIGQPAFYGVTISNVGNTVNQFTATPSYYEALIGDVSASGSNARLNVYDNLVYGIFATNSNFTAVNSAYQYMAVYGKGGSIGGVGVYGTTTSQDVYRRARVIPITPIAANTLPPNPNTTPFTNTFYDVRRAVDLRNYFEVLINGADVRSTQVVGTPGILTLNPVGGYGFYVKTNRYRNIQINSSLLTNVANGIVFTADAASYASYTQAQYVGPVNIDYNIVQANYPASTVTLQYVNNAISATDVISSYGATVGVLGTTGSLISTRNNRLLNVFRGIYTANWQRQYSHSETNYITMRQEANNFLGNATTQYGISHVNNFGNTIIDNNVNGTSRLKDSWKGIYSNSNGKEIVSCNYTNNLGRGIEFEGQHYGVTFNDNTFHLNAKGYMLSNNGVIGAQTGGGVSPATDNKWQVPANWVGANYHTYTLNSFAALSPLNVRAGAIYNPANNSGLPLAGAYTPAYLPVVSAAAFRTCAALPTYGCVFCVVSPLENVVQGMMPYQVWRDQAGQINQNRAYRMLKIDPSLMSGSSVLTNFYSVTQTTNTDQLSIIEDDLKLNDFADAQAKVASFVPVNFVEANYVKVYGLYMKNQTDTITTRDSTDLAQLANGCPSTDGVIVYQARALLNSVYNIYVAYEDNCPAVERSFMEIATAPVQANSYLVYPNPTKGELFISVSDTEMKETVIEVTDISGKRMLLQHVSLENGIGRLNLELDNGVYFVNISDATQGKVYTQKIIINK